MAKLSSASGLIDVQARTELVSARASVLEALREASRRTIGKVADAVAQRAKAGVPVKTGLLRDTIKGRTRKARGQDQVAASVATNTKGKMKKKAIFIGKDPQTGKKKFRTVARPVKYGYGAAVEVGLKTRAYTNTPYLRPALAESVDDARRIVREEAEKEARKQARAAKRAARAAAKAGQS